MQSGASFSPCRTYRYALWREWDASQPTVVFCGLNPSTADETQDDPTIRRELAYARAWGFGRCVKVNVYGYRSTDPDGLWQVDDPRGPDNFGTIVTACQDALQRRERGLFVACWGNNVRERDAWELRQLLRRERVKPYVLRLTKRGNLQHPLYLSKDLRPFVWGPTTEKS